MFTTVSDRHLQHKKWLICLSLLTPDSLATAAWKKKCAICHLTNCSIKHIVISTVSVLSHPLAQISTHQKMEKCGILTGDIFFHSFFPHDNIRHLVQRWPSSRRCVGHSRGRVGHNGHQLQGPGVVLQRGVGLLPFQFNGTKFEISFAKCSWKEQNNSLEFSPAVSYIITIMSLTQWDSISPCCSFNSTWDTCKIVGVEMS